MFKRLRERWKKAWTADNIVDLSVDIFLIVFDVLSSPILIVMRVVRWIINKFFIDYIKAGGKLDAIKAKYDLTPGQLSTLTKAKAAN